MALDVERTTAAIIKVFEEADLAVEFRLEYNEQGELVYIKYRMSLQDLLVDQAFFRSGTQTAEQRAKTEQNMKDMVSTLAKIAVAAIVEIQNVPTS